MPQPQRVIHVCRFDVADHLEGRQRTYEAVKAAVLQAGRFSAFEASQNPKSAAIFDRLCRDPELETFHDPPHFPWVGIRRRPLCDTAEGKK